MQRTILLVAALVVAQDVVAADDVLEEVVVVAERDQRQYQLVDTLDVTADSAVLLKKAVGANMVSNGPLTGMAQVRGMSRMRISTKINGAVISPGGPNWMDPPLSYAPAALVESLHVYRGIAPVSAGQETIGGVVDATNWRGDFGAEGYSISGRMRTGAQSVNEGTLVSAGLVIADEDQRLTLSGFSEEANDAQFAGGDVLPTEYERDRYDLSYGHRRGAHTVDLSFGRNNTGDAGTPALPMDISYIDSDLYGGSYGYAGERVTVRGNLYYNDIDHGMTNYRLRTAPPDGARYRRNVADGNNLGAILQLELDMWRVGMDADTTEHNSDIDNPNNPMFFVTNFNKAQRDVYGIFIERQLRFGERWQGEVAGRYNHVRADSGTVNATPAMLGMPPAVALRDAFNAADREQTDDNFDWVAKGRYLVDESLSFYAGVARKTRSPSYQERYLWLPLQATAGLADGLTYTGNLDLDPEVAHELELGVDWRWRGLSVAPRVFYRDVTDYIQGTPSGNQAAVMFVRMMNAMNSTSNPDPLEFNNVDAVFYGFDVDWQYAISQRWALEGVINFVRGKEDDGDEDLYRVPPLNAFTALHYRSQQWGMSVESMLYAEQDDVSSVNGETRTAGYGLLNLKGYWKPTAGLRLGIGVDNLADKDYSDHLGGVNRVMGNPDIAVGERLPGYGRNFFARLDFQF